MRSVFFGSSDPDEERPASTFVIPSPLTAEELRVLGSLIEKEFLTPDVYPMTVNGLINACNQKSSRDPVVNYDESTVLETLDSLQHRGLVTRITGVDHRVPKYGELLGEKTNMRVSEISILCVLMLRGPNTPGELKERANRIHQFASNEEVEEVLDRLILREPQNLVVKLPRQAGHKDHRYMHLLAGEVAPDVSSHAPPPPREDRVSKLEAEVQMLRERVDRLEAELQSFRKQFD